MIDFRMAPHRVIAGKHIVEVLLDGAVVATIAANGIDGIQVLSANLNDHWLDDGERVGSAPRRSTSHSRRGRNACEVRVCTTASDDRDCIWKAAMSDDEELNKEICSLTDLVERFLTFAPAEAQ